MKITKRLIMEMVKVHMKEYEEEDHSDLSNAPYHKDQYGYEGRMAKQNIDICRAYSEKLLEIIHDDEHLEPWMEEKISLAADYIHSVAHALIYDKENPDMDRMDDDHEEPDGDEMEFEEDTM
jgi:hypothetical protein